MQKASRVLVSSLRLAKCVGNTYPGGPEHVTIEGLSDGVSRSCRKGIYTRPLREAILRGTDDLEQFWAARVDHPRARARAITSGGRISDSRRPRAIKVAFSAEQEQYSQAAGLDPTEDPEMPGTDPTTPAVANAQNLRNALRRLHVNLGHAAPREMVRTQRGDPTSSIFPVRHLRRDQNAETIRGWFRDIVSWSLTNMLGPTG